jgi:hypothetical protein
MRGLVGRLKGRRRLDQSHQPWQEQGCSFCGKKGYQVEKPIAGASGVRICDDCVGLCNEIIEEHYRGRA